MIIDISLHRVAKITAIARNIPGQVGTVSLLMENAGGDESELTIYMAEPDDRQFADRLGMAEQGRSEIVLAVMTS